MDVLHEGNPGPAISARSQLAVSRAAMRYQGNRLA
jgi:hypothetical protein